jgi:LmbE family N-acetylglucosaminyl deacetylase
VTAFRKAVLLLASFSITVSARAQAPQKVNGGDGRFKADILIVVAHPDDEAFFTPYAAKAMNDMHKRVAVIFSTRGGSGANRFTRERGPAMANEREIEAREACAKLGIFNVWFLDGKDTASQNVLDSLASWGHGANLERLVGLIRLTRPEVIFTHYPGFFIGENHGDHQATGVLVTEAFDLASNPTVFPSQLAGDTKHYEWLLSNMQPWQPKKIYYGSDADDNKQFDGSGPTYSVREMSPSLKKPYWRLALESAMAHRTQFPDEIDRLSKMTDEQLEKMMNDPNSAWWSEPSTLIFGKSVVGGKRTDDVFANIEERPASASIEKTDSCASAASTVSGTGQVTRIELGGPWLFFSQFYAAHGLCHLKVAKVPELGVKAGSTVLIPLVILHDPSKAMSLKLDVKAPEGWKVAHEGQNVLLPAEESSTIPVHVETPAMSEAELKKTEAQEVLVTAEANGKRVGEVRLKVLLRPGGLPQ